jgi:hypothetical protein
MIVRPDFQGMDESRKSNKTSIIHQEEEDILTFQESDGKFNLGREDLLCYEVKRINRYSPRLNVDVTAQLLNWGIQFIKEKHNSACHHTVQKACRDAFRTHCRGTLG